MCVLIYPLQTCLFPDTYNALFILPWDILIWNLAFRSCLISRRCTDFFVFFFFFQPLSQKASFFCLWSRFLFSVTHRLVYYFLPWNISRVWIHLFACNTHTMMGICLFFFLLPVACFFVSCIFFFHPFSKSSVPCSRAAVHCLDKASPVSGQQSEKEWKKTSPPISPLRRTRTRENAFVKCFWKS